jgi:hypothetical protein
VTYWLHYAEGSAMTPLLLKLVFTALPKRSPGLIKPLVNAISNKAQSSFIDPQIEGPYRLLGRRAGQGAMVRRRPVHRRRHHDELPAGGRAAVARRGRVARKR